MHNKGEREEKLYAKVSSKQAVFNSIQCAFCVCECVRFSPLHALLLLIYRQNRIDAIKYMNRVRIAVFAYFIINWPVLSAFHSDFAEMCVKAKILHPFLSHSDWRQSRYRTHFFLLSRCIKYLNKTKHIAITIATNIFATFKRMCTWITYSMHHLNIVGL